MKFFCVPLFSCKSAFPDSLDFSQQGLKDVPKEVVKARKYLEELNLNVNVIEELPLDIFRCLKLKKLDISENKINQLPSEIGFLQSLMELNVCQNGLVELPEELGQCVNLINLNLSTNILADLPQSIVNLHMLTSLSLSNNSLTTLPAEIDKLVNLQLLDVDQCELRVLPPQIVNLARLRVLDLCENSLTELPEGMEGLRSLETLDLRSNMLTSIPPGLLSCKTLKNLDLSKNSISELPKNIGDLVNLTELVLCENKIISVPSSIGSMKKLEMLKLSHNCLTTLTPAICSCYELRDLSLCENILSELPSSIGNLNKLRFFDASSNQLTHLPSTIGGCSSLGVLSLRHNKLKSLPMEIGRLEFLKVLDIAMNDITYLPYTLTVLYDRKNLSALWLTLHQPPLPKLVPTFEPTSNIKVLTCCYLPQRDHMEKAPRVPSKSCVVGTRVCFSKELGRTNEGETIAHDEEEEEDKIPIGKFERYDTPHPKPFAPKNRSNRNSGDFSAAIAAHQQAEGEEGAEAFEQRPLRSVLKKRPVSTYSDTHNEETARITEIMDSRTRVIRMSKGQDRTFGWTIASNNKWCVFISDVAAGGAADRAGFRVDDRMLEINGSSLYGIEHADVVQLISAQNDEFDVKIERISANNTAEILPIHTTSTVIRPPKQEPSMELVEMEEEPRPPSRQHLAPPTAPIAQGESSESAVSRLSPSVPNIVSLTLKRDQSGSAGFSVTGTGAPNDPVRISDLTPNGPAQTSGKLAVGDRIISVNGVNVRNDSHDKVVAFLRSTNDLYLMVEREQPTSSSLNPLPGGHLAHARSMPSLVPNALMDLLPPTTPPPPFPPRRRASSRSNLVDRAEMAGFDFKAAIQSMRNMSTDFAVQRPRSRGAEIAAVVRAANPAVHDVVFNERIESPLATSSPVPPASSTRIPVRSAPSGSKPPAVPPPLAPKPKKETTPMPERMDFSSKLKNFEEQIASQGLRPTAGGPPPKKPLVSDSDRQKLREDEAHRKRPNVVDEPQNSDDYERLLVSSVGPSRPSVVRTLTAEKRAMRAAAAANGSFTSSSPGGSLDRKASDLEDREADRMKRQQWRKDRLESMEISADRSAEIIKILGNIPSSPIPTS